MVTECTSFPYGEGYSCTGATPPTLYTGKDRDPETGFDYFGARYYSSSMGRFTSPDWSAKEEPVPYASMSDPQSLNLYTYVGNRPVSSVDPDGHTCSDGSTPCWLEEHAPQVAAAEEDERNTFNGTAGGGGGGLWGHISNLLHGHSWNYVQTSVTTTETYSVSEPNSHVDLAASAAGLLSATPGAVPGAPGLMLGLAAGGVSSVNDPSALNLGINATGGALGVVSYFAEGTAVGTGATVAGFGVAAGATAWSASSWISTNIITPVFTPDANQSNTINANGVAIQAPDAFDWSQP